MAVWNLRGWVRLVATSALVCGCKVDASQHPVDLGPHEEVAYAVAALSSDAGADAGIGCTGSDGANLSADGGATCTDSLAQSVFQYAVCACTSLQATGAFTTDAYDSALGPPSGGLGANVGFGTNASWLSTATIGGGLWSPGGVAVWKPSVVRQDLHLFGSVATYNGATFTVDGNAFVGGSLPSSVKILGHATVISSLATPCDCGHQVPITAMVASHRGANNNDATTGLSATVAVGNNPPRIDLSCGTYYLSQIASSAPLTIAVHGHSALHVDGNVSPSSSLTFQLDDSATLDMFVSGNLKTTQPLTMGSSSAPAHCRLYVAGNSFQVPPSASFGCNIYAPNAVIAMPSTPIYGALFAQALTATASATFHYDTSIQAAGQSIAISPELACVSQTAANQYVALFGYDNFGAKKLHLGVGIANELVPSPIDRGQVEDFYANSVSAAFATTFDGTPLTWALNGQCVVATLSSPACSGTPCATPCAHGLQCIGGACVTECGDGLCAGDENCNTCPLDCACGGGRVCVDETCATPATCGADWQCGSGTSFGVAVDCGACPDGGTCVNHACQ